MRHATAGAIADVGALKQLDAALKHAVFGLSAVALATGPLADRVTFVETALGHANPAGVAAGSAASAGGTAGGAAPSDVGRSLYADEVAAALGTPNWQLLEAQSAAELVLPDPNPLNIPQHPNPLNTQTSSKPPHFLGVPRDPAVGSSFLRFVEFSPPSIQQDAGKSSCRVASFLSARSHPV